MSKAYKKAVKKVGDDMLNSLIAQLTESQIRKFNRIFPEGVPKDKINDAIDLCERTIKKNRGVNNE